MLTSSSAVTRVQSISGTSARCRRQGNFRRRLRGPCATRRGTETSGATRADGTEQDAFEFLITPEVHAASEACVSLVPVLRGQWGVFDLVGDNHRDGAFSARSFRQACADRPSPVVTGRVYPAVFNAGNPLPSYVPTCFYTLLELDNTASHSEVKEAYRRLQKVCHPDLAGEVGGGVSILLNEAFSVLTDVELRKTHDALVASTLYSSPPGGYRYRQGQSISVWAGKDPQSDGWDQRAVFVDEGTCTGCTNCVSVAPSSFRINNRKGRARVFAQWADTEEDIEAAIASCPVDCIHWVRKNNLPALEHVTQSAIVVDVAIQNIGGGKRRSDDPFTLATKFVQKMKRDAQDHADGNAAAGRRGALTPDGLQTKVSTAWLRLRREEKLHWGRYREWILQGGAAAHPSQEL